MHPTHPNEEPESDTPPARRGRGLIIIFCLLVTFLLLTFIPPLINVSRFQQRIARNISASLGRPVHFKSVSLNLLPMPGFTLEDFVVEDDPAFSYEPILRADSVRVTLRISSLWRQVEFSRISLTEPTSVNLVRADDGRWNIQSLFLQASRSQAAPTAQRFAGPDRRFPYIEATGARLNLKLGEEKTPVSLTDADFALWLPEAHQWHLRVEAHPTRTDTNPGDTGTLHVEGTLGGSDANADSLADVPLDLHGEWRDAQLGGLSRLLFGHDPGLRGDFAFAFTVLGTVGHNDIATNIKLVNARRADFVPDHPLSLEAACRTVAQNSFHSFTGIECHWPPADSSDHSLLILTAEVPDTDHPNTASATLNLPALPAGTLLDWLSVASQHPPTGLDDAGTLAGTITWHPNPQAPDDDPAHSLWSGQLEFSGESITLPGTHSDSDSGANSNAIPLGDIILQSTPPPAPLPSHTRKPLIAAPAPTGFDLLPIELALGGTQPAILEGHIDTSGYTLHLTGTAIPSRLLALGAAIPQFGEGLAQLFPPAPSTLSDTPAVKPTASERGHAAPPTDSAPPADAAALQPTHLDLTATRTWGGPQTWHQTTPPPAPHYPIHK